MKSADVESEAAYYQSIEEFFVSRRGDPLLLSNADWLLIRKWRRAGIPLRIVLRGVGDALDAHEHSWGRTQKVGSLQYCAAEVESARERWVRALADGGETKSVSGQLDALEGALRAAGALGPGSQAMVAKVLAQLPDLRRKEVPDLETELGVLERRLLACIRRETRPEVLERAERGVDADLAPYRARMPEKVASQIREDALSRTLLGAHGLPRLTLFS